MQEKANFWSFILSLICIFMFLIVSFSNWFTNSIIGFHPLTIVLIITLITFLFGVFGFSGVGDWKGMARSVSTVVVTFSLSVFLGYVFLIGNLFS